MPVNGLTDPTAAEPGATSASITDLELVARVRAGELHLFELLMRRHNQRLFRTARAVVHDDAEAEDVLQEAWVKAYAALDAFAGRSSLSTWLVKITLHEAFARQRRRRRFVALESEHEMNSETTAASPNDSPEVEAGTSELRRTLAQCIDLLPETLRPVFVLREVEELSTLEAAEALGISEENVKVRLHRARASLRLELERRMGSELPHPLPIRRRPLRPHRRHRHDSNLLESRDEKGTGCFSRKPTCPLWTFFVTRKSGEDMPGYDEAYKDWDSPLARKIRQEAHGRDIGQHSWVTAEELEGDVDLLGLTASSHLLDLGCGPGGPLAFVVGRVGCRGTGADLSAEAIAAGRARARDLGLDSRIEFLAADLDRSLALPSGAFDAAISIDVVLHLKDRAAFFAEVMRLLAPGARLLFTDAGILTGAASSAELARRSLYGFTQFAPVGFNENTIARCGFALIRQEDRTSSLLRNASGRLVSREAHRAELEAREGLEGFSRQQGYLEVVIELARRGALSRAMYLVGKPG